jgi:hypothetical protein
MYFPYLRCKQFELLALRELSQRIGSSEKMSPVLEPVKRAPVTLEKGLDALTAFNVNFNLIINPSVGELSQNHGPIITLINNKLSDYGNYQIGVVINQSTDLDQIDFLLGEIQSPVPLTLIHTARPNNLETLLDWAEAKDVRYNLYTENIPTRRYRGVITPETRVILEDNFNARPKNADYLLLPDEFFSDEHLYFEDDNNVGFSDYLMIGADYIDSGFLPYAVAIHLTYIKSTDRAIWIHHFVSDSNRDNLDVAGKFGEALQKLVAFIDEQNITTDAANEFRDYYRRQHYPGLGTLKKLAIKNHLELLLNILQ